MWGEKPMPLLGYALGMLDTCLDTCMCVHTSHCIAIISQMRKTAISSANNFGKIS